jgi:hypothetical protein
MWDFHKTFSKFWLKKIKSSNFRKWCILILRFKFTNQLLKMKFVIRIFFHGIKHHYQAIGYIYVKLIAMSSSQNQHLNIAIYFSNGENIPRINKIVYLKVHLHSIKSCATFPKKMFALFTFQNVLCHFFSKIPNGYLSMFHFSKCLMFFSMIFKGYLDWILTMHHKKI